MEERKEYSCVKRTKKTFQDTLAKLAREKPLNKITVKALCEAAGLSRNAFYFHYADIDALIEEIEDDFYNTVVDHLEMFEKIGYPGNVQETVKLLTNKFLANRDIGLMLLDGQRAVSFVPRLNQMFADFNAQYFHNFHPNSSRAAYDYFFTFIGEGYYAMVRRFLVMDDSFPEEKLVDLCLTLMNRLLQNGKPSLHFLERPMASAADTSEKLL